MHSDSTSLFTDSDFTAHTEKRCLKCKIAKPLNDFHSNKNSKDGKWRYCKSCACAMKADQYRSDPSVIIERVRKFREHPGFYERQKLYMAEWRRNNPTKAAEYTNRRNVRKLENGGSFTPEQFTDLCHYYGNVCLCCMEEKPLIPDHVIPVVKGGTSDISNIQPLCAQCNRRKHVKTIDYRPD